MNQHFFNFLMMTTFPTRNRQIHTLNSNLSGRGMIVWLESTDDSELPVMIGNPTIRV